MGSPTWQDIIGLIKAVLSWPVVALIVLLVFREKVRGLFDRVTKVDSPIGSAEFVKALVGAESSNAGATGNQGATTSMPPYGGPGDPEGSAAPEEPDSARVPAEPPSAQRPSVKRRRRPRRDRLPHDWVTMATANPSGLVIKSWEQLSNHINAVARQVDSSIRTRSTVGEALNALLHSDLVNEDYVDAALALRNARNMVAHDAQVPSIGAAEAYATTAEDLRAKLVAHP